MSKNLSTHFLKDLKSKSDEISVTDYENVSIFCKFEDEYFSEEIAQEFLGLIGLVRPISNSLSIDLRDNAFTDLHMKKLASIILKHKDIKELVLWLPDNYITDEGAVELLNVLDVLKSLNSLTVNFEWNFRISNKTLQNLCRKLPTMSQLKFIKVLMSKLDKKTDVYY